ncbi:MAG: adenylyl cyclase, partial [Gammaproteobacteria bacterium]|nr:adenylyl cyclase [Gammaproteobacteria bacterium]
MSFFTELGRRNVIRVGAAYVVVGWILAQVAEFAFENFGAPEWVLKSFVVFLLLGLPIALFFAWAFEITPEGVKREKEVDRSRTITRQTGRTLD